MVVQPSGGGATLAAGYFLAGLQPATHPAVSVTQPDRFLTGAARKEAARKEKVGKVHRSRGARFLNTF